MRQELDHDETAWSRRWRPALLSFFLRRVRKYEEAEDLTQEVFIRMLNSRPPGGMPDGYIFQIAQNLLVDRARRAKVRASYRETLGQTDEDMVETLAPDRIVMGRAELARIAIALEQLPERTRDIFTLYRIEQLGQEAIAEAFGISVSAVKKQVAKAMAQLMQTMQEAP